MNFLNSVEVFLQVVELGSFTKAAQMRDVTPGMVSTQVSELEKEFGVRLLHRSTRKLALTEEGTLLYGRLTKIVQEIDETKATFLTPSMLSGKVRVVAGALIINFLMLPIVNEFSTRYPGITLELLESRALVGTKGEERDLIIRYGPFEDSNLVAKPMGITRMVLAASPEYLALNGMPRNREDLLNHRCCGLIDPASGHLTEWMLQDGNGRETRFLPRHTLRFSNAISLLEAAVQGLGLVFMAEVFLQDAFDKGLLMPVLPDYSYRYEGPCVLYHRDQMMPARVRAFLDFLIEKFPSDELMLTTYRKLRMATARRNPPSPG